jgi:hypothetical protein
MLLKTTITALVLMVLPFLAQAGEPNTRFTNFGVKDGITDKAVYICTQDKVGYMWFGTSTGLFRYDGHEFIYVRSPLDGQGRSIANILQSVYCDKSGILWLGSFTDLQWYDPQKNQFWRPRENDSIAGLITNAYILNITEDETGNIWIATSKNGFFKFNRRDSSFTSFSKKIPAGIQSPVVKVVPGKEGEHVAVLQQGVLVFREDDRPGTYYPLTGALCNNAMELNGDIYISVAQAGFGVVRFNKKEKKFYDDFPQNQKFFKSDYIYHLAIYNNEWWVASYNLYRVKQGNELQTFTGKQTGEFDLQAWKISYLFTDRHDNPQNQHIRSIVAKDPINKAIVEPSGLQGIKNSNDFVIGSTNGTGIFHYQSATGQLVHVPHPGPVKNAFTGIVKGPQGEILASDFQRLYLYDPIQKKLTPFQLNDVEGKPLPGIFRACYDQQGNGYLACYTRSGYYYWPAGSATARFIAIKEINPQAAANDVIYPCLASREGDIWFTGSQGVYKYSNSNQKYTQYLVVPQKNILAVGETRYMAQDKSGHLWISTLNNGLYELYFENGKEKINNYNKNSGHGIDSDYINKLLADPAEDIIWIQTSMGLLKFDPVKKQALTYINKQRGMEEDGGYSFSIPNPELMVQPHFGVLSLIPLKAGLYDTHPPSVHFNTIKVLDKEYVYLLPDSNPVLRLQHNQNFLRFEFTSLSFANAGINRYAWLLDGLDKDWVQGGNNNIAMYSRLKSGTYYFRVKASNADGVWGPEKVIKIVIKPPFYATWWFIALSVLAVLVLFYAWNRMRLKQARKEEKLKSEFKQQISETEMKALRAQMNPHFIFNSLNSIQKYILKNEHFEASQYLTKFSRLIRLILDHSNQNSILLSSELDLLKLYIEMESLRFDNKFDYSIRVNESIQPDLLELPSMLVQPYVENAIWHGLLHKDERGRLDVHFSLQNNTLQVVIEDDGIGREKAAELKSKQVLKKKSYGMQITEDRIAIINRVQQINATCTIIDKKDENGSPSGTRVLLHIPIKPLTR